MAEKITLLLGGDIQFDTKIRPPRKSFCLTQESELGFWGSFLRNMSGIYFSFSNRYPRIPRLLGKFTGGWFDGVHKKWIVDAYSSKHIFPKHFLLDSADNQELYRKMFSYKEEITAQPCRIDNIEGVSTGSLPFRGIRPLLEKADLAFANLECPLSKKSRVLGMFKGDPLYAAGLKQSGVDVVSLANNHMFDAGESGILETLDHLERAGVRYVGGGRTLTEARQSVVEVVNGCRIGFLAYTQFSDNGFSCDLATEDGPGILPFSMPLILEDIKRCRDSVDTLIVSLHWLSANTPFIHQEARKCAYEILDGGADMIVGHHPHVYKPVEVYKGKPILYSLGNLIFGHSQKHWGHNLIALATIRENKIIGLELVPVSGRDDQLFQPQVLTGDEAGSVIKDLQKISRQFETEIHRVGDRGQVVLDSIH